MIKESEKPKRSLCATLRDRRPALQGADAEKGIMIRISILRRSHFQTEVSDGTAPQTSNTDVAQVHRRLKHSTVLAMLTCHRKMDTCHSQSAFTSRGLPTSHNKAVNSLAHQQGPAVAITPFCIAADHRS